MDKAVSLNSGRLYQIQGDRLVTCDDQQPELSEELDYTTCERLGLLCEECRQKIFFVKAGVRATGEEGLTPVPVKAHFNHYGGRSARDFCSQRALSTEGKKAYQRVLTPVARGQWLERFQVACLYAVNCDPVHPVLDEIRRKMKAAGLGNNAPMTADAIQRSYGVPMNADGTFTLYFESAAPIFRELRLTPEVKRLRLDSDAFLGSACEIARSEDGRELLHRSIDEAWGTVDKIISVLPEDIPLGAVPTPNGPGSDNLWEYWEAFIRHALVNQEAGGRLAQAHCAHLALDFLLAKPQDGMLKALLVDSLGAFELAVTLEFGHFLHAALEIQRERTIKTEQNMQKAVSNLQVEMLTYSAHKIALTPWQHVWEASVDYAKVANARMREREERQARVEKHRDRQRTPTRGQGFG